MPRKSLVKLFLMFLHWGLNSQNNEISEKDKHVLLTERHVVNIGYFANSKSVFFNVDGILPNKPFDFGETLGLRRQGNTVDLNYTWRFSPEKKWYASLSYFAVRNDQSVVLEDEFKWSNTIYPIGVVLNSGFNVDMYRLFFGRVISMGKKHELSGGLGLHTLNMKTFVQASAYLGDLDVIIDSDKKNLDVLAPVPNIGFQYLYAPNHRWAISANIEWFSLGVGDYKGTLWDVSPSVSYQLSDHIGLGFSYKYFQAKIDMNKNVWKGSADLIYEGPLLYICGTF